MLTLSFNRTLALTSGEAFLPDSAAYDDLFYKLVESGEALTKLRDAYELTSGSNPTAAKAADKRSSINVLISVSEHYQELINQQRSKKEHLSEWCESRSTPTSYIDAVV